MTESGHFSCKDAKSWWLGYAEMKPDEKCRSTSEVTADWHELIALRRITRGHPLRAQPDNGPAVQHADTSPPQPHNNTRLSSVVRSRNGEATKRYSTDRHAERMRRAQLSTATTHRHDTTGNGRQGDVDADSGLETCRLDDDPASLHSNVCPMLDQ